MRPPFLHAMEPIDSDVDLTDPAQRQELRRQHGSVVAVIAAGGVIGALLRYQLGRWWPTASPGFPWTTLLINVTGSLLLGVLIVVLTERRPAHRWLRPFIGTGILGGFTTFSTWCTDIVVLLHDGRPAFAALYLVGTLAGALSAGAVGISLGRRFPDAARPDSATTGTV